MCDPFLLECDLPELLDGDDEVKTEKMKNVVSIYQNHYMGREK